MKMLPQWKACSQYKLQGYRKPDTEVMGQAGHGSDLLPFQKRQHREINDGDDDDYDRSFSDCKS